MAMASMVFGMKRAVIVSFLLCLTGLVMIRPKRITGLVLMFPLLILPSYFVPDISYHFIARMESIAAETNGFTSGQARESEVKSILKHLDRSNDYIFGSGLGSRYTYFDYRGGVQKNYQNSHVSFFGWWLRVGIVGAGLLSLVYLIIILNTLPLLMKKGPINRYSVILIYVIISIIPMSFISYNLTGNFITNYLAFSMLKISSKYGKINYTKALL